MTSFQNVSVSGSGPGSMDLDSCGVKANGAWLDALITGDVIAGS